VSTKLDSKTLSATLTDAQIFTVLTDALKDAYKELLDVGLKTTGSTLIVLGWFAAQRNPLEFLCQACFLVIPALVLVVAGFVIVCFILAVIYRRAQDVHGQLLARGFDAALFSRYRVTPAMLAGGFVGVALVLGGVFWYILYKYGLNLRATCLPR
jgi:hypothetical protein